jgi:hypothetical protein
VLLEEDVVVHVRAKWWVEIDEVNRLVFDMPSEHVEVVTVVEEVGLHGRRLPAGTPYSRDDAKAAGIPFQNIAALVTGAVLGFVALAIRDSAVAIVFGAGAVALVLWAFLGARLKSVGPKGVQLFEETKDRLADKIDADASLSNALQANQGVGQAAAAIRGAKTPQALADVLVTLLDRPAPATRIDPMDVVEAQKELKRRGYHDTYP